jgi:hypothetical protein
MPRARRCSAAVASRVKSSDSVVSKEGEFGAVAATVSQAAADAATAFTKPTPAAVPTQMILQCRRRRHSCDGRILLAVTLPSSVKEKPDAPGSVLEAKDTSDGRILMDNPGPPLFQRQPLRRCYSCDGRILVDRDLSVIPLANIRRTEKGSRNNIRRPLHRRRRHSCDARILLGLGSFELMEKNSSLDIVPETRSREGSTSPARGSRHSMRGSRNPSTRSGEGGADGGRAQDVADNVRQRRANTRGQAEKDLPANTRKSPSAQRSDEPANNTRQRRGSTSSQGADILTTSSKKRRASTSAQGASAEVLTAGIRKRRASTSSQGAEALNTSTRKSRDSTSLEDAGALTTSTRKRSASTSSQDAELLTTSTRKRRASSRAQAEEDPAASTRKRKASIRSLCENYLAAVGQRRQNHVVRSGCLPNDDDEEEGLPVLDEAAEDEEAASVVSCHKKRRNSSCSPPSSTRTTSSLSSTTSWLEDLYEAEWGTEQARLMVSYSNCSSPTPSSTCSSSPTPSSTSSKRGELPPARVNSYLASIKAFQAAVTAANSSNKDDLKLESISGAFMADVTADLEQASGGDVTVLMEWAKLAYACVFLCRRRKLSQEAVKN